MKGTINRFIEESHPGNYSSRNLNVGDVVFSASDPYGCVDKSQGQAVKFHDDSPYPYFEVPLDCVDWEYK